MSSWDDDKSTAADPDNPNADEQLTADEWDNHVTEGHWLSDDLNLGTGGNGDPVITDPQNADEIVMRYDRSAGTWVLPAVSTENTDTTKIREGRFVVDASDPAGILSGSNIVQQINDAFSVIQNVNGNLPGRVVVPRSSGNDYYGGTDTITIPRPASETGMSLIGHGMPEIRWDGNMTSKLIELPPGTPEQNHVEIDGFMLSTQSGAAAPVGIDLWDLSLSTVSNIHMPISGRITNAAIRVAGENTTASRNRIENSYIKPSTTADGISVGAEGANEFAALAVIEDCEINGDVGVRFRDESIGTNEIRGGGISNGNTGLLFESGASSNYVRTRIEKPSAFNTAVDFQGDDNYVQIQSSSVDVRAASNFAGQNNTIEQPGTTEGPRPTDGDHSLNNFRHRKIFVQDDDVKTINQQSGLVHVYDATSGVVRGMFLTSFNDMSTVLATNITNNGGAQLSGTTGTDGDLNVSLDGSTFYLENRLGSKETFGVLSWDNEV